MPGIAGHAHPWEHHRGDKRSRTRTANAIAEPSIQARTPGSAGALAGMILSASTNLPNNR
ncbi:MAG: hypothetical protein EB033_14280 [Proteobacteria bacterium]|nr:hypothetical protein [Pseudomonadota bacterium]